MLRACACHQDTIDEGDTSGVLGPSVVDHHQKLDWEAVAPTTEVDERIYVPQTGKLRSDYFQGMIRIFKVGKAAPANYHARVQSTEGRQALLLETSNEK